MTGADLQRRRPGGLGYWPFGGPLFAVLVLVGIAALLFVGVAGYVYKQVGISSGWFEAILIGSFVGSRINIPVARLRGQPPVEPVDVVVFGLHYRFSAAPSPGAVVAVNVGGALIPTAVSIYLIVHDGVWQRALIATACVAVVVWAVARPVPGVGIVTPSLVPPATAAVTAIIIGGPSRAALAYICGTLGTLVGADLVNLGRVRRMRAPVASIGGAGTFDGIFLAGLLAVVFATL